MELVIRPKSFQLGDALREYLELRLRFALTRFHQRIRDVVVTLADVNGPRGGIDKRCRVVVRLTPSGKISIDETDVDFETAIAHASERVHRAVARKLDRRQKARTRGSGTDLHELNE